jgi:hypothetical protein
MRGFIVMMMVWLVVQVMVQTNNLDFSNLHPRLPSSLASFSLPPPLMSLSTQQDSKYRPTEETPIIENCLSQCDKEIFKLSVAMFIHCMKTCFEEHGYP